MRLFRLLALLFVLTLLVVVPSSAGNGHGAMLFHGSDGWIWWFDWNEGNLAVYSSEQNFSAGQCPLVEEGEWIFVDYKGEWVPPQKQNYWWRGPAFTRIYLGVDPDTYPGWDWGPVTCNFLQTFPRSAEGISEMTHTDIDTCNLGPGRNTWSDRVHSFLYTPKTVCSSGIAKHDLVLNWMISLDAYVDPITCIAADPSQIRLVAAHGPSLKCIGK
jgi:hypothetical protein